MAAMSGKGSLLSRLYHRLRDSSLSNYLWAVKEDYKSVALELVQESRNRPLKATAIGSIVSFMGYAIHTNPDLNGFYEELICAENQLGLIPETIRNPEAYGHVHRLRDLNNQRLLNRTSCVLFSILWRRDFDPKCGLFVAQCRFTRPSLISYWDRVEDIGFLGKWRILGHRIVDYDVNPREWRE
jgi:hypothetical protein